tara:strand:- start:416 stop:1087 length:672 start_codon:yes stop_codon:yes gene_type:complete
MSLRPKQRPDTDKLTEAGAKSLANANKINQRLDHFDKVARHYEALGMRNPHAKDHAMMTRASLDPSGYKSLRDFIDGGGPGMRGAMFSSKDLTGYDQNGDGYVSQAEFDAMQQGTGPFIDPVGFNQGINTGIASFSNNILGMRPLGSYAEERTLGSKGRNIGLDRGLFGFMNKGGVSGALLNLFGKGQMNPDEEMYSSQGAVEIPASAEGGLMALRYYLGGLV